MNIIIVRNAHSLPWRLDLGCRRQRACAIAAGLGAALLLVLAGAFSAIGIVGARGANLEEVQAMREVLQAQRAELARVGEASHRDLDALAMQLGQLQAQATRLNALGDRLAEVGKLGDGEFDFSSAPALGGPEDPLGASAGVLPLQLDIDNLRAEFDRQEAQLDVLDNLLRDRTIDNSLVPSGMPVKLGYISSHFGSRTDPIGGHAGMHRGIDFDVPYGSDILAVADGVVTWSGQRNGYGNVVEIDHGNGYMTRYAHNSRNISEVGTRVHAGEIIAKVGSTGRSTGPHCHFEVWLNGRAVNPIAYVRKQRAARG